MKQDKTRQDKTIITKQLLQVIQLLIRVLLWTILVQTNTATFEYCAEKLEITV